MTLHLEATAISTQGAIRGDNPMARNHNRYGIAIIGHADRSKAPGPPHSTRNVAIAPGLPVRDGNHGLPALQLKVGPAQIQWELELAALSGKVLVQFADIRSHGLLGFLELHTLSLPAQVAWIGTNGLLPGEATVKLQGDQATLRSRQKQRADRRFHRCAEKSFHGMRGCPWAGNNDSTTPIWR